MNKAMPHLILGRCVLYAVVACLMAVPPVMAASTSMTFDFERWAGPGSPWSTLETYVTENGKILGLFNDRNKNYLPSTHLSLKQIPADTPVTISFDLYLVGTWDSGGRLADRWTMATESGHTLLDLTKFPNAYQDDKEEVPIGNEGIFPVGSRKLAYWILHESVTVPPDQIVDGALTIVFKGYLTGRKTEFWGLDNVNVKIGK